MIGPLGYRINGLKLYPECKWMAIAEPAFVNQLRAMQNKLAESVLNSRVQEPWNLNSNASDELIKMDDLTIDYIN